MSDSDSKEMLMYVLRQLFENIDVPYVYLPLGIGIFLFLTYPITQQVNMLYFGLAFLILAFAADWYGRYQNSKPPQEKPEPSSPAYREDLKSYHYAMQEKAFQLLREGKRGSAIKLTDQLLQVLDNAIEENPEDPELYAMKGFSLKDIAQFSKNSLPRKDRIAYLNRAEEAFLASLDLDPDSADAHNGMGNIYLFRGDLDKALEEMKRAIELVDGGYPAAEHDKIIVERMIAGEIDPKLLVI